MKKKVHDTEVTYDFNTRVKTDDQVICDLINALHSVVGGPIEAAKMKLVDEAIKAGYAAIRRKGNGDISYVHEGFVEVASHRVEVSFFVPGYATAAEKDSSFLAHLAEKILIKHVQKQAISL